MALITIQDSNEFDLYKKTKYVAKIMARQFIRRHTCRLVFGQNEER